MVGQSPRPLGAPGPLHQRGMLYLSGCAGNPIEWRHARADDFFKPLDQKVAVEVGKILRRMGYEKDKHQSQGRSGKKRRWRPSGTSRRRTTPEAGQTPASDSDVGIGEVTKSKPLTFRRHTDVDGHRKMSA